MMCLAVDWVPSPLRKWSCRKVLRRKKRKKLRTNLRKNEKSWERKNPYCPWLTEMTDDVSCLQTGSPLRKWLYSSSLLAVPPPPTIIPARPNYDWWRAQTQACRKIHVLRNVFQQIISKTHKQVTQPSKVKSFWEHKYAAFLFKHLYSFNIFQDSRISRIRIPRTATNSE